MTYQKNFPDFDNAALFERIRNALEPYGFHDSSWHNDACPSLTTQTVDHGRAGAISCHVFLNYQDEKLREVEFPGADIWFSQGFVQLEDSEAATDLDSVLDVLLPHGLCNDWNEPDLSPDGIEAERRAFMVNWLERNAAHIATGWEQEVDGTGIGYWVAHGTLNGKPVEYHLGCDFEAGTRFHSDGDGWQLTAFNDVGLGDYHILSSGADLHDVLKLSSMDIDIRWARQ